MDSKQDTAQDGLAIMSSITPLSAKNNSGTAAKADGSAELKNGKVIFKQKPLSFEKQSESLQEIVSFREMLERRIARNDSPLLLFPLEYKPLIAKLAHESDKTLTALTKHIHHELMPTQDEDEQDDGNSPAATMLPFSIVETAIKEVVTRNNYGLDGIDGTKPPAAVCVWRWEVSTDHYDWLPKNARHKAESRLAERIQAKKALAMALQALPFAEREAIMGTAKLHQKQKPEIVDLTNDVAEVGPAKMARVTKSNEENGSVDPSTSKARPKRTVDPEKAAKEKERQDKKAAKAEKEKKEKDSQNKARSMMANFFSKPRIDVPAPVNILSDSAPSTGRSEYEKTFKPFVLKKDTVLAPSNPFVKRKHDTSLNTNCASVDMATLRQLTPHEHLRQIISALPPPSDPKRFPRPEHKPPSYKSYTPVSIRSMLTQVSEAEVAGDIARVRALLGQLADRKLFPAKVLIFHQDARPGYYGTWTRSSRYIGPRTPLARDPLEFDYGYDSGEEWEIDAGDADDVVEDGEEDDLVDEADSDLDSWLVDDDEELDISATDFDSPMPDIDFNALPPPPKRKADDGEKKAMKKRKVVVPLVPFASGPCLESKVGQCSYEPFEQYRIQLLNDTPFPINPFTFVSTCVEDSRASQKKHIESVFAVPELPNRVVSNPMLTTMTKKPALPPKTPFPDAHLQFLFSRINDLQSPNITFLVDAIYHELRAHKVKKNAIEAKVREVGERCKEKKIWVIKPEMIKLTSQS